MAPTIVEVNDPADDRLHDYLHLSDADLRNRTVDPACFIVEGHLALAALAGSPFETRSVLVADNQLHRVASVLEDLPSSVALYVASSEVVNATVGFRLHRGVVASAARPTPRAADGLVREATRLLVVEGVNDHENLGALFRNAAAFGVDAVLMDPRCADPLYRRSVRVSLGHVLRVPFAVVDDWPCGLTDLAERFGLALVALTPDSDAPEVHTVAAQLQRDRPGAPVAVMVGAEGPGLTDAAIKSAGFCARIGMASGVDSLNVATAAAVALYALRDADGH